jgi:hypothetical protein
MDVVCAYIFEIHLHDALCMFSLCKCIKRCNIFILLQTVIFGGETKKKNNEHNAKYPLHMHIAFYFYFSFFSSLKTTTLKVELAQQTKYEKKGKWERANDRNKERKGREVSRREESVRYRI